MDVIESYFHQSLATYDLTALDVLIRLISALLMSGFLALMYRQSKGASAKSEMAHVIIFSSLGVCLTLIAIGNSVPTAFGLFAALSLIRFRTPVKQASDLVLIFISVAIGISCGVGAFKVGLVGAVFIGTIYRLKSIWLNRTVDIEDYFLRISGGQPEDEQALSQILSPYSAQRVEWNRDLSGKASSIYKLSQTAPEELDRLIQELSKIKSISASLVFSSPAES